MEDNLNSENFIMFMEGAIKKYDEMDMLVDAMLWKEILKHVKVIKKIADNADVIKSCHKCQYSPCVKHGT